MTAFLHDEDYIQGKRHFKLFCFFRIFSGGVIQREKGHIRLVNYLLECTGVTVKNPVV